PALMAKLTRRAEADDSVFSSPFPMIVHSDRRHDWEDWARAAAVVLPGASRLIELNSMVTVVNAACQGVGVALIPMPLSERLFADGSLIRAHDFERATQDRYYFVTSEAAARTKPIQELRSWILTTFANVA
ncbi:MAG: LysR substrate-binding domain-containing protein, partial [Pseudomonadota bacterium]